MRSDLWCLLLGMSLPSVMVVTLAMFMGVSVDELASLTIGTIAVLHVLFAVLGLVKCGHILFHHHLLLSMGEGALIAILAFAVQLVILAHFGAELVYVWRGWGKVVLSRSERLKEFIDHWVLGHGTFPL